MATTEELLGQLDKQDTEKLLSQMAPKPEAPKPRDQVSFLGSEKAGKMGADLFPRTAKAATEGKGYGSQVGNAILDLLSLPGRGIASSGEAPAGATWEDGNEALGKIQGDGFVEKVLRDPGTGAAVLAAPFTAGLSVLPEVANAARLAKLANYARVAGQGAVAGTASAAAHQGENALEGRGIHPLEAAGEIALNALLPAAARGGGKVLKGTGKKILNTIIKPKEGVQDQIEKTGFKTIADLIFAHNLDSPIPFTGGVEGIQARNAAVRAEANKAFGQILDDADRQVTLTSKAPPGASQASRSGIDVSGGVADSPIYTAPEQAVRIEGGDPLLTESTVPGPSDVVRAGMNRPPLLTDGKPGIVITPAPRPVSTPPEVVITPNPVEMPNQIDPRFIRPRATSTPNQPPIADAPAGSAYGIPSDRNLPIVAGGRGVIMTPKGPIPMQGADPFAPEELRLLGRDPGVPAEISGVESPGAAPSAQGPLGLPPGTPESTVDLTKKIDLGQAIENAFGKLMGEFSAEGKNAGVLPGIEQGRDYWKAALAKKTADGVTPIRFSQGFKQEAGDAGNFLATDPGDIKGKARFANALYRETRDMQNELLPDLKPLNKILSETHPIKNALEDAIPRLEKNNLITPSDMWAMAPAAVGGAGVYAAGNPLAASLAFATPLAINRLSKNPTFASQMYRLGETMVDPGVISEIRKRAIERALATGLFSESQ